MFVGRKRELEYLEENYKKLDNQVIVLYGHKGVGKTALMSRFVQEKLSSYYLARPCSMEEQMYLWNSEMEYGIPEEQLSYADILNKMYEQIITVDETDGSDIDFSSGKRILVIDEFQNVIKYSDTFMLDLIRFVKDPAHSCMVVLCSSSISFVENGFVPRIGSLALGINGFLKVHPLKFIDCIQFFDQYSTEECMNVYCILGGFPAYWKQFSAHLSVVGNIEHMILYSDAYLREEGERLVSSELRELNVYCTILACLSNGMNKLNDLHRHTGFSRAKISVYLKNLMELELVEKVYPFDNASSINAKKGIYRVTLPYLDFYYRFIFGKASKLNVLGAREFYEQYIRNEIPSFYEKQFKKICKEYMDVLNMKKALPIQVESTGEWIGKDGTIDYIIQDEDETNILCFCNMQLNDFTVNSYENCLKIAESARLSPDYIYIFSKGLFTPEMTKLAESSENIKLIDINSL